MTYYWKWIKRLCYDAQREIFETAVEEVAQVRELYPPSDTMSMAHPA